MPTYDYKCDACGHAFEKVQSIKADSLKKCPECGKQKLRRLIGTGGGFIFKGSGFYITDYRDAAYKEKAKAEAGGGDSKPSESKESKDSKDSKPAAETKTETKSDSSTSTAESKPAKTEAPAAPSTLGKTSKAEGKNKSDKK